MATELESRGIARASAPKRAGNGHAAPLAKPAGTGDVYASSREYAPAFAHRDVPALVAIPAYNEERCIGSVVLQVQLQGYEVLVIDDGSGDDTAEIAAAAGARVERHERNQGKAAAMNTAFGIARALNVPALVVLDGDGQHRPAEIERVLRPVLTNQADVVIGSRFLMESEGGIPPVRRGGQAAVTLATNVASGTKVTDSQSGFRAFSRAAIELLHFSSYGFSVEVEMQFQARAHGLRILEMPITALYFDAPKRNVVGQGLEVLNGILKLVGRHRPFLFFSVPGMILLLIGLGFGLYVTQIYLATQTLAIGYAFVTVLAGVIGMLALFTGLLLHSIRGAFLDLERRLSHFGR